MGRAITTGGHTYLVISHATALNYLRMYEALDLWCPQPLVGALDNLTPSRGIGGLHNAHLSWLENVSLERFNKAHLLLDITDEGCASHINSYGGFSLTQRIDVLMGGGECRRRRDRFSFHRRPDTLDAGHVLKIMDYESAKDPNHAEKTEVLMTSPILTLVNVLATCSDEIECALLVHEVMGRYRMLPSGVQTESGFGFVGGRSLVTPSEVLEETDALPCALGKKRLVKAFGRWFGPARSPQEAILSLQMGMRRRVGGMGLPKHEVNARIDLETPAARRLAGTRYVVGDLVWRKAKCTGVPRAKCWKGVVVERQGGEPHYGLNGAVKKATDDNRRRRALEQEGWSVIFVTPGEASRLSDVVGIAEQVARELGKPFVPIPYGSEQWERMGELHERLHKPGLGRW